MGITDPSVWFRGKAIDNARKRIKAASWDLFTARPHDPDYYPGTASAEHCGWHGKTGCGSPPTWAVMVPLRSANRLSTCSLGTLEIVANYTARAVSDGIDDEVMITFEGASPDESSEKVAQAIVELYQTHRWSWVAISALFDIKQQRTRLLYDYVMGPGAHKVKRPRLIDAA